MSEILKIENLIEMTKLQDFQDNFAKATNIGVVTINCKGQPITKKSEFTCFCNEVRKIPQFRDTCKKCDALGGLQSAITGEPHIYICHMGLIDFAVPIIVENTYIGSILAGQVKICDLNDTNKEVEQITKLTKWNNTDLMTLYNNLPTRSFEEIKACADLLYHITNHVVNIESIDTIKKIKIKEESKNSNKRSHSKDIEKAVTYIEDNIKKQLTLDDVAKHINLSTHYLSKLFKKEMNINFVTYLTDKKIELAKLMLQDPEIPIVNIAIDLSYNHPNYFSKVFKRKVGLTPSEYRDKIIS